MLQYKRVLFKKTTNNQLILGRQAVLEAIESGISIERVFIKKKIEEGFSKQIKTICKEMGVPYQVVPVEKLNRMTKKNHQGVILQAAEITYYTVEDILSNVYDKGEIPLFLVLDGVTDIHNFGAIARTAWGCGVHAIIIPTKGNAMINEAAIKKSAGALLHLPICRTFNLKSSLNFLKENGLKIVSSALNNTSKFVFNLDAKQPLAIIMGSEGEGVSNEVLAFSDITIKIPMANDFDSFNVSVASGMILYELLKQRRFN